jgi:hypothetical protein
VPVHFNVGTMSAPATKNAPRHTTRQAWRCREGATNGRSAHGTRGDAYAALPTFSPAPKMIFHGEHSD